MILRKSPAAGPVQLCKLRIPTTVCTSAASRIGIDSDSSRITSDEKDEGAHAPSFTTAQICDRRWRYPESPEFLRAELCRVPLRCKLPTTAPHKPRQRPQKSPPAEKSF